MFRWISTTTTTTITTTTTTTITTTTTTTTTSSIRIALFIWLSYYCSTRFCYVLGFNELILDSFVTCLFLQLFGAGVGGRMCPFCAEENDVKLNQESKQSINQFVDGSIDRKTVHWVVPMTRVKI